MEDEKAIKKDKSKQQIVDLKISPPDSDPDFQSDYIIDFKEMYNTVYKNISSINITNSNMIE